MTMDFRKVPELSVMPAGGIPWGIVCQHLDYIADSWKDQVAKSLDMRHGQEQTNQSSKVLRNERRHILRTQGPAAARRNEVAYAESDSALFWNIDDDSHLETDYLDSQPQSRIDKGFARFSAGAHKAADLCKHRWSPLLIATQLEQMRSFAETFSPTDPSIASSRNFAELHGLRMVLQVFALRETAAHLLCVIECLHLGAAMGAVLGSDAVVRGQHSGPKLEPTCRALGTVAAAHPADDNVVVTSVVIEEIVHSEPAAYIDQEAAELQAQAEADDQFAYVVERRLQASEAQQLQSEKVHLISFRAGQGELFRKMLLEDKEFKPLRLSLQEAGCPLTVRPFGAVVLVKPTQYFCVMSALGHRRLKRYQLLITESVEYLMDHVLARMASKSRPRERRGERVEFNVDVCKFVCRRSFICEADSDAVICLARGSAHA